MRTVSAKLPGWRPLVLSLALVLASSSVLGQGTINYVHLSTPNPDPNFPWDYQGMRLSGGRSYNLDFNGDGSPEYVIYAAGASSTAGFAILPEGQNSVWVEQSMETRLAAALSSGIEVGSNLSSSLYGWQTGRAVFSSCVDIGCLGNYTGLDSAYLPLRFDLAGNTHYGWVQVGSPIPGNFGWIYDYAYETRPGIAISTGAKPVVIPLAPPGIVRPGYLRLRWMSEVDVAYQVQAKVQLDEPVWANLEFTILATSTNSIVDIPVVGAHRFFRIVEAD